MATAAMAGSFQRLTISTTPVALTVPQYATYAVIRAYTNDVTYQDDGTTVTATNGQVIAVGGVLRADQPLGLLRFIRTGASDGEIRVSYYSA